MVSQSLFSTKVLNPYYDSYYSLLSITHAWYTLNKDKNITSRALSRIEISLSIGAI